MELVATSQCLHHLPCLQVVNADSARLFVVVMTMATAATFTRQLWALIFVTFWRLFFLLILEAWNWIYDVFYFLWRSNWIPVLIQLLAIFIVVLVSIFLEVLLISMVHSWWTTHSTDIDPRKVSTHVLSSCLPVVIYILGLAVLLKLIILGLLTSRLALWLSNKLAIEVHLNRWITLKLCENVLYVIHDIG